MLQRHSWTLGLAVSVGAVAVVTGAIYALREVVPVVSTGIVYLLAVGGAERGLHAALVHAHAALYLA